MLRNILSMLVSTLLCGIMPSQAADLDNTDHGVAVYAYYNIGDENAETPYLSQAKFDAQIDEIRNKNYRVIRMQDAFTSLPPSHAVLLTFDNPDQATYQNAIAKLVARQIPFTIFISPGITTEAQWQKLQELKTLDFITLGLSSYHYDHMGDWPASKLFADINQAKALFREKLGMEARYFAYPYGEFSSAYRDVIAKSGFKAAFGQNSGILQSDSKDIYTLPRFAMTEEFGDIERFRLTSAALPFPVQDIDPAAPYISELNSIGFTATDRDRAELKKISCFSSQLGKIKSEVISQRVELRFAQPASGRIRINCTIPVTDESDPDSVRYRWLGFLYVLPETQATGSMNEMEELSSPLPP